MRIRDKEVSYVQLFIDIPKEVIDVAASEEVDVARLPSMVPTDAARYHLFLFKHTHEGDYLENIVFIYSMPGYNCPIKERMLYSSCKASLIAGLESAGIPVVKAMEIDNASELSEKNIYEEVHPTRNVARQAFARPKGPGGRGPKRMTRPKE